MIAVLIPTRGTLFTQTVAALDRELTPYVHVRFYTTNLPIPDCRNALMEQAMSSGLPFTHYLMMDDDVFMPEGGLQAMLDMDTEVVVIDYPSHWTGKNANCGNVAYTDASNAEIYWAGLGCTLVKAEVFDRLKKPYFRSGGQMLHLLPNGRKVTYGVRVSHGGEDFEFYQDCRALGIKIQQVKGMVAGHAKIMRHVGVIEEGKYAKQHDIHVADKIERPLK